jgi:8-amino-7-oxononanoate synthase
VVLGESARAMKAAAALELQGILTQAIRPPTVPQGSARLRLTVTPQWSDETPERVATAVARAVELA